LSSLSSPRATIFNASSGNGLCNALTRFSFRDDNLLLVAMDQSERSRVRIVISAQRNKVKATYDGQILVDMGGNEIQLYNGPVDSKTSG
jgi:hypothetical protein